MSLIPLAAFAILTGGALAALAGRDARPVVGGLTATLIASALIADPSPPPAALAARLVGAGIVGELLWVAFRRGHLGDPAGTGLAGAALLGAAGVTVGLGLATPPFAVTPDSLALGAGLALFVVATPDLLLSPSLERLGVAVLLALVAAILVREAFSPALSSLEHLLVSLVEIAAAGSVCVVIAIRPAARPVAPSPAAETPATSGRGSVARERAAATGTPTSDGAGR